MYCFHCKLTSRTRVPGGLVCIAEKLNLRRFQVAALLMFLTKLLSIAIFLACHHWAIRETVQV